jgi:hypothetical protein
VIDPSGVESYAPRASNAKEDGALESRVGRVPLDLDAFERDVAGAPMISVLRGARCTPT